jgi:hypothetical protein
LGSKYAGSYQKPTLHWLNALFYPTYALTANCFYPWLTDASFSQYVTGKEACQSQIHQLE